MAINYHKKALEHEAVKKEIVMMEFVMNWLLKAKAPEWLLSECETKIRILQIKLPGGYVKEIIR